MEIGVSFRNYGDPTSPEAMLRIARAAERCGFDTLWATDHVVTMHDIWTGNPDGQAVFDATFYEPIATLHWLAPQTTLRLGIGTLILPYREPLLAGKMLAGLDQLSGGRLVIGAASGWVESEFVALGVPFAERGERSDEILALWKHCWSAPDPVRFSGKHYRFEGVHFLPRPRQRPHPPIWIGGNSRRAMRRAVELGDGWFPVAASPGELAAQLELFAAVGEKRGRDVSTMAIALRKTARPGAEAAPADRQPLTGSSEQIAEDCLAYGAAGVTHLVVELPFETVDRFIEDLEQVGEEVLPRLR